MDLAIYFLILVIFGLSICLGFQRRHIKDLKGQVKFYDGLLTARQSNGGMTRSKAGPRAIVERPRTSKRDTDDLPRTGRMSRLTTRQEENL